jgi:hypothetical protein
MRDEKPPAEQSYQRETVFLVISLVVAVLAIGVIVARLCLR